MGVSFFRLGDLLPEAKGELLTPSTLGNEGEVTGFFLAETCEEGENPAYSMGSGHVLIFSGLFVRSALDRIPEIFTVGRQRGVAGAVLFGTAYSQNTVDFLVQQAVQARLPLLWIGRGYQGGTLVNDFLLSLMTELRRSERRSQDRIFEAVLSGALQEEGEVRRRYGYGDYPFSGASVVLSLRAKTGSTFLPKNKIAQICHQQLQQELVKSTISGFAGEEFLVLLSCEQRGLQADKVLERLAQAVGSGMEKTRVYCGLSDPFCGFEPFGDAARMASLCSRAMLALDRPFLVRPHSMLLPYTHLLGVRDQKRLITLSGSRLEALFLQRRMRDSGREAGNTEELINTLECYFASGCNKSATAERLFIHRNTLQMRLDKIEKLCGIDLNACDDLFELQFELVVNRLLIRG